MGLRVPRLQVQHVALAVRLGMIVLGIRIRVLAEQLAILPCAGAGGRRCRWRGPSRAAGSSGTTPRCPLPPPASAAAPAGPAADGPGKTESRSPARRRARTIPRPARSAAGTAKPAILQLFVELLDALLQRRAFDPQVQIADPQLQQVFVRPVGPDRIARPLRRRAPRLPVFPLVRLHDGKAHGAR